jgi:hypothetical protein
MTAFYDKEKYMPIKKSVRLIDTTVKLCHELTQSGDTNYSGAINAMAGQYKLFVSENLPLLTEQQKTVFYCAYNGYFPPPDIEQEIQMLPWQISEGYQYDTRITELLGTEEQALGFIEQIKKWSKSQKLSVIYMARAYWKQGQIGL